MSSAPPALLRLPELTREPRRPAYESDGFGLNEMLIQAIFSGDVAAAESALKKGARCDGNAPFSVDSVTPRDDNVVLLHYAAKHGRADIIRLLVRKGADPNVEAKRHNRFRPLHFAALRGGVDAVTALLECGADPDPRTQEGDTPLRLATERGHIDAVRVLLNTGRVDIHSVNDAYYVLSTRQSYMPTSVWDAVWQSIDTAAPVVPLLLERCPELLERRLTDRGGIRALHVAVSLADGENLVKLLLDHGAIFDCVQRNGQTPLVYAAKRLTDCSRSMSAYLKHPRTSGMKLKEREKAVIREHIDMRLAIIRCSDDAFVNNFDLYRLQDALRQDPSAEDRWKEFGSFIQAR